MTHPARLTEFTLLSALPATLAHGMQVCSLFLFDGKYALNFPFGDLISIDVCFQPFFCEISFLLTLVLLNILQVC